MVSIDTMLVQYDQPKVMLYFLATSIWSKSYSLQNSAAQQQDKLVPSSLCGGLPLVTEIFLSIHH